MNQLTLDNFLHKNPELVIGVLWFLASVMNGMPAPNEQSGVAYRWAYNVAQACGANLNNIVGFDKIKVVLGKLNPLNWGKK